MTVLALETSCDETSAAVARHGCILANVVSSQIQLHAEYGGVVPELATREHLRNLMPVTRSALREARLEPDQLDAVAATRGPGLPNALMIGFKAGQALAFALGKPFIGIHHLEAHLYSPWVEEGGAKQEEQGDRLKPGLQTPDKVQSRPSDRRHSSQRSDEDLPLPQGEGRGEGQPDRSHPAVSSEKPALRTVEPNVSLIVSGGHTMLVLVRAELEHQVLGGTLDDAAGECFDKVGKMLGLAYPAGPQIDRLAEAGNPRAYTFPRPMLNDPNDDFSFSGLKTSVRYFLQKHPELAEDPQAIRDLCASVQAAIVEVLVTKTIRAARRAGVGCVTASGGVTCNRALRRELAAACARERLSLRLAGRALCTDNAGMIGVLAERKLLHGQPSTEWGAEIAPNWAL